MATSYTWPVSHYEQLTRTQQACGFHQRCRTQQHTRRCGAPMEGGEGVFAHSDGFYCPGGSLSAEGKNIFQEAVGRWQQRRLTAGSWQNLWHNTLYITCRCWRISYCPCEWLNTIIQQSFAVIQNRLQVHYAHYLCYHNCSVFGTLANFLHCNQSAVALTWT